MLRRISAALAGAAVASVLALLLGEYPFTGLTIVVAAIVFGLFVAEAVVSVGRHQGADVAALCAVLSGVGLTWSGWISTGHHLADLGATGWVAVAVGIAAAVVRARPPRRAADSPVEPTASE